MIEDLIQEGAKLDYYNKAGNNAFHEACGKGQLKSKSTFTAKVYGPDWK